MLFAYLTRTLKFIVMKKIGVLMIVASLFFAVSCDKFTLLSIPLELPGEIAFSVDAASPKSFNDNFIIKLNEVPELEQYLDKIDQLSIKDIKIAITEYADSSSKNCVLNGTVKYSSVSSVTPTDLATFNDVNIYNLFMNQSEYTCTSVVNEYINVADLLKNEGEAKFYLNGDVSDLPAVGKMKIIIVAEAKVKIL